MDLSNARYNAISRVRIAYMDRITARLGETNDWIIRLMQATLDLYAVAAGATTLPATSLPALAGEGAWVKAMMAARDTAIADITAAASDEQALAVAPTWPEPPT